MTLETLLSQFRNEFTELLCVLRGIQRDSMRCYGFLNDARDSSPVHRRRLERRSSTTCYPACCFCYRSTEIERLRLPSCDQFFWVFRYFVTFPI